MLRRILLFAPLAGFLSYGQRTVPPEMLGHAARLFQSEPGEKQLACQVHPDSPVLSYRMMYRVAYKVTIPLKALEGQPSRDIVTFLRLTPEFPGAQPMILREQATVPQQDPNAKLSKLEAELPGRFFLGEGKYRAELVVVDRQLRFCRRDWQVEVRPHPEVKSPLTRGQVSDGRVDDWRATNADSAAGSRKVSILLDVGGANWNPVLLDSIAGLLGRLPFREVRLVAFSLRQHKELFRESAFAPAGFERIQQVLEKQNQATVSYKVLEDTTGHRDFLWQLLQKEKLRKDPSDMVLFIGANTLDDAHPIVPSFCSDGSKNPLYAYFDYRPWPKSQAPRRRNPFLTGSLAPIVEPTRSPEAPDVIGRLTRACSGKVFSIHAPQELASALEKTEELLREH